MLREKSGILGYIACLWFNLTVKTRKNSWLDAEKYHNAFKWTNDYRKNASLK